MSVTSTTPTTRRGYLSQSELEQFANISITDGNEADDVISQAEELIDVYVGPQNKAIKLDFKGRAESATTNTITVQSDQQNVYQIDYLKLCEIEILGGTGAGQRRKITGQTLAGVITVDSNWDTIPDNTSFYKISQLGKFPRIKDVHYYSDSTPNQYYKSIPEEIKRAVAAQVQYIIDMGEKFFSTDKSDKESERIADYSYTNAKGTGGMSKMISPKARILLKYIKCRVGTL